MVREPFVAKYTSIWLGAFFFWLFSGFKGKYRDQLIKEKENRNMWIGYIITIVLVSVVVWQIIR